MKSINDKVREIIGIDHMTREEVNEFLNDYYTHTLHSLVGGVHKVGVKGAIAILGGVAALLRYAADKMKGDKDRG